MKKILITSSIVLSSIFVACNSTPQQSEATSTPAPETQEVQSSTPDNMSQKNVVQVASESKSRAKSRDSMVRIPLSMEEHLMAFVLCFMHFNSILMSFKK